MTHLRLREVTARDHRESGKSHLPWLVFVLPGSSTPASSRTGSQSAPLLSVVLDESWYPHRHSRALQYLYNPVPGARRTTRVTSLGISFDHIDRFTTIGLPLIRRQVIVIRINGSRDLESVHRYFIPHPIQRAHYFVPLAIYARLHGTWQRLGIRILQHMAVESNTVLSGQQGGVTINPHDGGGSLQPYRDLTTERDGSLHLICGTCWIGSRPHRSANCLNSCRISGKPPGRPPPVAVAG